MSFSELDSAVEFAENPEARCPCVLLLDISGSMAGAPITALNQGLRAFKEDLSRDPLASRRVEVALVAFHNGIEVFGGFSTIDRFEPPELVAGGQTHMGGAVLKALDMVTERKAVYKANAIPYYRPWIFLITDGEPQGEPPALFEEAVRRVHDDESQRRIAFFGVGVEGANMAGLSRLCVRTPVKLLGLNFVEMFVWLSKSASAVAASKVDEMVTLPPPGWVTV